MRNKLKKVGFSIPYIPEHTKLVEAVVGFELPNVYVEMIREYSQCEFMDAPGTHGVLFIHSVYGLLSFYDRMALTIAQMGDPLPLSLGLFPFASNADGGLFWDTRQRKSGEKCDYKVASNPLWLKDDYETDQSWGQWHCVSEVV